MKFPIRGAFSGNSNITQLGYRANSAYDPDPAAGALQNSAQTFSYWSQFYTEYSVLESKLVVTIAQINSTGQPIMVAVSTNSSGTGPGTIGDWDAWCSTGNVKQTFIDSGKSRKLVSRWSCKRFGADRTQNTGKCGPFGTGSDPLEVDYHVMACACVNPGASFVANSPNIYGHIYYKVLLTKRTVVTFPG
jgi:hypothetical protein